MQSTDTSIAAMKSGRELRSEIELANAARSVMLGEIMSEWGATLKTQRILGVPERMKEPVAVTLLRVVGPDRNTEAEIYFGDLEKTTPKSRYINAVTVGDSEVAAEVALHTALAGHFLVLPGMPQTKYFPTNEELKEKSLEIVLNEIARLEKDENIVIGGIKMKEGHGPLTTGEQATYVLSAMRAGLRTFRHINEIPLSGMTFSGRLPESPNDEPAST